MHPSQIQSVLINNRLKELITDGYCILYRDQLMLTQKGMSVLLACADHKIQRPKLSNQGNENE